MAKKKPAKKQPKRSGEAVNIRIDPYKKKKLAAEARLASKTMTQIIEDLLDTRYSAEENPVRQMQLEFKRASERMQIALSEQIERTTKMVHALVMIQQYAESHGTNHKDFAHFIINACKDSLRCQ